MFSSSKSVQKEKDGMLERLKVGDHVAVAARLGGTGEGRGNLRPTHRGKVRWLPEGFKARKGGVSKKEEEQVASSHPLIPTHYYNQTREKEEWISRHRVGRLRR